jgi:hypothetical protein
MEAACSSKTSITCTTHYGDASQETAFFIATTTRTSHLKHSLAQYIISHMKEKSRTRKTMKIQALQGAMSLKIPRQDFKASNGWAVRFTNA